MASDDLTQEILSIPVSNFQELISYYKSAYEHLGFTVTVSKKKMIVKNKTITLTVTDKKDHAVSTISGSYDNTPLSQTFYLEYETS